MRRFLLRAWRWLRAEIVFGFLIATVFWTAILGWQAAYAPTDAEKQKCYDSAEQSGHNREECKSIWERTTSDPVAFFTFWLVVSTIGLGISTLMLWVAGEKQFRHARRSSIIQSRDMKASVNETRRIGEAQVRAYVDISSSEIFFVGLGVLGIQAHPMVRMIATNTGQSPARNFVWNPTLQYFSAGIGVPPRSLTRELGSNWRNILGVGIPVNQSHPEAAMIPEMELRNFLGEGGTENGLVLVRLRVQFEFEDVFDERNIGEAYFSGMFKRIEGQKPMTPWGENQWSGQLTRLHRPSDWPEDNYEK
jgi:hypothetical protein